VNQVRVMLVRRFRRRLAAARVFHRILFDASGRSLVRALSSARLLPFRTMLSVVR
jgi:hypothetical protein